MDSNDLLNLILTIILFPLSLVLWIVDVMPFDF